MELCRATLSRAPFLPAAPPSLPVRDFRKRRVVCLSSGKSESTESPKDTQMVVSVTGATGFIGRRLVQKLLADKHKVRVLTRSITKARFVFPVENFPEIIIAEEEEWKKCIEGSNAVVNLAGMPISTRWSPEIKKEIMQSRINVTSKVVDLINHTNAEVRPSVLVSATAIGYYGTSETQVFDETSPSGNDYLSEVCREWETKAHNVDNGVRLVLIRIGVVLGKDGAKMIPLFMMFAGGPLGTGNQWFSWIHLDDLVNLICQSLTNPSYKGVINGTAPNPVRLSEMCDQLGQVIGRPSWLPVPDFAIKAVLGEGASIVLEGQRVLPAKAKELGFSYKYPYVKDALKAIVREL
ncbi:epimerase family protein SDR39U1 homolog, chloroplastic isoform X2 [Elaeis guineensis]|uniref:Epimerase family protein SDR39U1 homolog, chloroplastic isoform X2 n=1 Tax=Elaeis guineensis var. tenera TaxID=51953 RepID=A0A6I9QAB8_ELAGV|nr:epimerase family protein SDR39U1 homolog, chloroplastic isoform X2 [Elaeis guineensis]